MDRILQRVSNEKVKGAARIMKQMVTPLPLLAFYMNFSMIWPAVESDKVAG